MNTEEHKARHKMLQEFLGELVADFIRHTDRLPSRTTIMELMRWAAEQAENPTTDDEPRLPI